MFVGARLVAFAAVVCLGPRAADAVCQLNERMLPCNTSKGEDCTMSGPGGLYPGEVFYRYGVGDPRSQYCKPGGTVPAGEQCEVQCQAGYGDMDGADFNHVACTADGRLDWTSLPSCLLCDQYSYQDKQSSNTCKLCPSNTYTGKEGATNVNECDKCKPGTTGEPGNCQVPKRPEGWGNCPNQCDPSESHCALSWRDNGTQVPYDFSHFPADCPTTCDVVNIVGIVTVYDDYGAGQWIDGLRIFEQHINSRGGLRLGNNSVGYVNVTVVRVNDHHWPSYLKAQKYRDQYNDLCFENGSGGPESLGWRAHVDSEPKVYLTPPDVEDDVTGSILELSAGSCSGKTFLVGSEARFPQEHDGTVWPGVFSVYGQESQLLAPGENTINPVELLHGPPYNARTFGIAGVDVEGAFTQAQGLKRAIAQLPDAVLATSVNLSPSIASAKLSESLEAVAKSQPDVFIAIGDDHGVFENMLSFFAKNNESGYSPRAAFYMGGLAVSSELWRNSYTSSVPEGVNRNELGVGSEYLPCKGKCWSFDQWMGFVPWTVDMPHAGPTSWPNGLPNPYHMAADDATAGNDHMFGMRQRYLGSAKDFSKRASDWLRLNKRDDVGNTHTPSFYHAKAAASLLLFQMAVELAPDGGGYGLRYNQLTQANIQKAMHEMNSSQGVETFWGPIRVGAREGEGWNHMFKGMGIGQFRDNQTYPTLVHYTGQSRNKTRNAQYPARWPDWCLVNGLRFFGECRISYLHTWEIVFSSVVAISLVLAAIIGCCAYKRQQRRRYLESSRQMRRSLLGSAELPDSQLTGLDIASRWATARVVARTAAPFLSEASGPPGSKSNKTNSLHVASVQSGVSGMASSARTYSGLTQQTQVPVMFSDSHVRELQPSDWQQVPKSRLGRGTYGTVYRAEWRGVKIAVKAIELPNRPKNDRDTAREAHKKRLQKITRDFVKEVDVGCELLHPNLVQMLGYATEPMLIIAQELMAGGSLDKQLYVEHWRPNKIQLLKGALDVAEGMEHLHTYFERGAKGNRQSTVVRPVIHRDLKSPNILLDRPPPMISRPGDWDVEFKVSDFGLSRDKQVDTLDDKTGAMSGVGSVLWMAPEMLRGDNYNESVDVYSYAMVLVELSHCTMPWQDTGARPHEVPHRVTNDERPDSQLAEASDELQSLIRECWHKFPSKRPTFTQIKERVTDMYVDATRSVAEERLAEVPEGGGERDTSTYLEHSERSTGTDVETTSTEYASTASRPASPPGTGQLCGATSSGMSNLPSI